METLTCLQHRTRETVLSAVQLWGDAPQGPRVSVEATRAALRPPAPRRPFLDKVWARRTEVKSLPGTPPIPFTTPLPDSVLGAKSTHCPGGPHPPPSAYDSFRCLAPPPPAPTPTGPELPLGRL